MVVFAVSTRPLDPFRAARVNQHPLHRSDLRLKTERRTILTRVFVCVVRTIIAYVGALKSALLRYTPGCWFGGGANITQHQLLHEGVI